MRAANNLPIRTVSGDTVFQSSDYTLVAQASCTLYLPNTPAPLEGDTYEAKSDGAYTIVVNGNGANIDGAATFTMSQPYQAARFQFNGTIWNQLSSAYQPPSFSAGVDVKNGVTDLGQFTSLQANGTTLTATDAGGGIAQLAAVIPTPTVDVQNGASDLGQFSSLKADGTKLTATNSGGGLATLTTDKVVQVKNGVTSLGQFSAIKADGTSIVATDAGSGVAQLAVGTVSGSVTVKNAGTSLGAFTALNTDNASLVASDQGSGVAGLISQVRLYNGASSIGSFQYLKADGVGIVASDGGTGQGLIRGVISGYGTYAQMKAVSSPRAGDRYVCSDAAGEWVYDGSIWRPIMYGVLSKEFPLVSTFGTSVNLGTSTLTDSNGRLIVNAQTATTQLRGKFKAAAVNNGFTAETGCDVFYTTVTTGANPTNDRNALGVACRASGSSRIIAMQLSYWSAFNPFIYISDWSNETTRTQYYTVAAPTGGSQSPRLRIQATGGNIVCSVSNDGLNYVTLHSIAIGVSTFDQVGFVMATQATATQGSFFHWSDS